MAGTDFTDILDEDILHIIYGQHMNVPDLQALRLLSRRSNTVASAYLFRTIIMRLQPGTLLTITRIAENEIFARGVRELVWETAHYIDTLSPRYKDLNPAFLDDHIESGHLAARPSWTMAPVAERLQREEDVSRSDLVDTLQAFLAKFTGLRRAKSKEGLERAWERTLGMTDPIDGKSGPLPIFLNRRTEPARQERALLDLLHVTSTAGSSIVELLIHPVKAEVDREISSRARGGNVNKLELDMSVATQLMSESALAEALQALRRLTRFCLRFRADEVYSIELPESSNLGQLIVRAPLLEDLEVSLEGTCVGSLSRHPTKTLVYHRLVQVPLEAIVPRGHIFHRLGRLALHCLPIGASQLCNLLTRHGDTLQLLILSRIMLNCYSVPNSHPCLSYQKHAAKYAAPPSGRFILRIPPKEELTPYGYEQLAEWRMVARTCRLQLPRLRGLRVETPMLRMLQVVHVPRAWLYDGAQEVEETGMGPRRNILRE